MDSAMGFDFVHIPGAEMATGTKIGQQIGSNICGQGAGLVTATGSESKSICCECSITCLRTECNRNLNFSISLLTANKQPFVINFRSDAFEMPMEAKTNNRGFTLGYTQDSINCP